MISASPISIEGLRVSGFKGFEGIGFQRFGSRGSRSSALKTLGPGR